MNFLFACPAEIRFGWELKVCLYNLVQEHKVSPKDIYAVFSDKGNSIPRDIEKIFGINVYVYPDKRKDKTYYPSIQSYLLCNFFNSHREMEKLNFLYVDSDIIFRKLPDLSNVPLGPHSWFGSDCIYQISSQAIDSKNSKLLHKLCTDLDLNEKWIRDNCENSSGVQKLISHPSHSYFKDVYDLSNKLFHYLDRIDKNKLKQEEHDYPLQSWYASMLAEMWMQSKYNIHPHICHALDFSWAPDDISCYGQYNILHNSGVQDEPDLFDKWDYLDKEPFDDDLSYVNKNKCSYKYVKAIKRTEKFLQ